MHNWTSKSVKHLLEKKGLMHKSSQDKYNCQQLKSGIRLGWQARPLFLPLNGIHSEYTGNYLINTMPHNSWYSKFYDKKA